MQVMQAAALDGGVFLDLENFVRIRTAASTCALKAEYREKFIVIERPAFDDLCAALAFADKCELERRIGKAANQ